jgi:hypothetical protein
MVEATSKCEHKYYYDGPCPGPDRWICEKRGKTVYTFNDPNKKEENKK